MKVGGDRRHLQGNLRRPAPRELRLRTDFDGIEVALTAPLRRTGSAPPPLSPKRGAADARTARAMNPRWDVDRIGLRCSSFGWAPRSRRASPAWLRPRRDAHATSAAVLGSSAGVGPGTGPSGAVPTPAASAEGGALQVAPAIGQSAKRSLSMHVLPAPAGVGAGCGRTRWETDLRSRGRTLKRNQAQEGAGLPGQQWSREHTRPDDGARHRSRRSRSSHPDERGTGNGTVRSEAVIGANGRDATAAVTRNGCRRGVLRGARTCAVGKPGPHRSSDRCGRGGNTADPRTGSGMQQARDSRSGGSRRSGAKPQGRNRTSGVAPPGPKRRPAVVAGVDATGACRWRGDRRIVRHACRAVRA